MNSIRSTKYLAACFLFFSWQSSADDWTIIHAGKLMSIPGQQVKHNQSIVIKNDRIERVDKGFTTPESLTIQSTENVRLINLKDKFVLPGLIDGHVHITDQLNSRAKIRRVEWSHPKTALFGARNARILLNAGFTTVRDLGGRGGDAVFALRDAIEEGFVYGARIFAAGDVISPTGGHGQRHGFRTDVFNVIKHTGICDGLSDCRKVVRNQVRRSADHIKFVSTGGVLSETAAGTGQQFFDDEITAIIETAHSLGRKVTAHAHNADGINAALRLGVDSIEHGTFANKESWQLFRQKGAYLVPTLLAGDAVTVIANSENSFFAASVAAKAKLVGPSLIRMVRRAHKEGVKLAFGTDSYVSEHGVNAREFELLVKAGLSPEEAIITATVNGADNLGQSEHLGSIEKGKYADIIAVDNSPLADITELQRVSFVMKAGMVHKSSAPY